MSWAIHSLHAPPVQTDDQGRYSLNGRDWIKAGVPIHTAETREEAEQWQAENIARCYRTITATNSAPE